MKKGDVYMVSVIFVMIIVTAVSAFLAYSVYTRNIKDIANKIVGVELSDVSEIISYDIELGKDIEKSFDLGERIIEHSELFENIEDLYIMDGDGRVIASTGDSDVILPRDLTFLGEGYLIENGLLYSINSLSDDVSIVATTKADFMDELDGDYIYNLINFSVIGGMIVGVIFVVLYMTIKDLNTSKKVVTVVLAVWVFAQGAFIAYANYTAYTDCIVKIEETVTGIYEYDLSKITSRGIDFEYIGGIEEYLERYIKNVDEIADIDEQDGKLEFTMSKVYMNRMVMNYFVQNFLVFIFSMIILGEFRLLFFPDSGNTPEPQATQNTKGAAVSGSESD